MAKMNLNKIFIHCFSEIGGESNTDVKWYLYKRPKRITRDSFFRAATWAIWVAGKSRKSASTFLYNAEEKGFSWDYLVISSWDMKKLQNFIRKIHGLPVPKGAFSRWSSIHKIAKYLYGCESDISFRKSFFDGKSKSADLDKDDAQRLFKNGYPYIGLANANYILRSMGGEFIKPDRWINAFLEYYNISLDQLENKLKTLNIPLGLFDLVIWAYCEKFIFSTNNFDNYFKIHFE